MSQPNVLELAKQGDANAIASLINRKLQPKGITAKASIKNDCLQIMLEAAKVPPQETLVSLLRKSIPSLGAESIKRVKVYGKQTGEEFPAWNEEFEVEAPKLPTWEELAKDGDVNAISTLINQWLNSQNITVKVSLKNDCLQVKLESAEVPQQESVVSLIRDGLINLNIKSIKKVKIFGQQTGDDFPDWLEEFELEKEEYLSILTPEVVKVAAENSNSIVKAETDYQLSVQEESNRFSLWGSITKKVKKAGGAIADTASGAGKVVVGTATGVGGAIANSASHAGKFVIKTTTDAVAPIVDATGKKIEDIKKISTDWLIRIIDKVDIVKAETEVRELEKKYPDQKPDQIAHHLMVNKALLAAGSGLASNLLPGSALAMAGVDMAATTALSAELVYQIAAAYGQDLQSSDRKGEVLTIFGLSLGGNLAIDAGLGLIEKIPIAGAVINASASAAMIYALGYGACRFYEAKNSPLTMEATLVDVEVESQKYLESAIAQEVVMDQILIHIVLAGNPGKDWSKIMAELQAANLAPASLEAISNNIKSPPPLETLLAKINHDFAVPLLAQCQKIAQLDGVVTPEEAKVIEIITKKFDLDMAFGTN